VHDLESPGTLDLVDRVSLPGLVALMRRSSLLVTTDSGPIQLAGASGISILGIYSVVEGRCRLPYRNGSPAWMATAIGPSCPHAPCYRAMSDETIAAFCETFTVQPEDAPSIFSKWCVAEEHYACMRSEITASRVLDASLELLKVRHG
jgi:ADP-heptose:LPS heptosyltransferase